jgi:hypothetical protein
VTDPLRERRRQRIAIALSGATSLSAIAALIAVLAQAPKLENVERATREVRQQIVTLTLHLPRGVHATLTRKEVRPGNPIPHGQPGPAPLSASALPAILQPMHDLSRPGNEPEPEPEILMPPEMFGGHWANVAKVARTPHELTIDFIRMGPAFEQGIVVARVSFSPLLAAGLLEQLQEHS